MLESSRGAFVSYLFIKVDVFNNSSVRVLYAYIFHLCERAGADENECVAERQRAAALSFI